MPTSLVGMVNLASQREAGIARIAPPFRAWHAELDKNPHTPLPEAFGIPDETREPSGSPGIVTLARQLDPPIR